MSARQAFQPRNTITNSSEDNHISSNKPKPNSCATEPDNSYTATSFGNASTNKPLNLSGLVKYKEKRASGTFQSNQSDEASGHRTNTTLKSRPSFESIQRPIKAIYSKPPSPRSLTNRKRPVESSPRKSQSGRTPKSVLLFPRASSIPIKSSRRNRSDSVSTFNNRSASSSNQLPAPQNYGQSMSYIQRSPSILAEDVEESNQLSASGFDDQQLNHPSSYDQRDLTPEHEQESQTFSQPAPTISAIDTILDLDSNAYVENHMQQYDQEKAKWASCSMDDWVKGADGMFPFA